ncbi:MAG: IPT/TIG domain-containing protein [Acidobacteria bacterium]|nr:IPT/TIG domain-containing protein [Acidobacteriota bacterium]
MKIGRTGRRVFKGFIAAAFGAALVPRLVGGPELAPPGAAPRSASPASPSAIPNPILFVTQVPVPADFTTIGATFGNHLSAVTSCARGGDLYIRYTDGTLKNLTSAAGYGNAGFQGPASISVRDPHVHWSGTKAIFSMVVGATANRYQYIDTYWQLYEITGFEQGGTPVITKVPNQPATTNNISPIYGTDGRIIFTSDRARNGAAHLRPQLDEYEEAATVTGLWSLHPGTGELKLLTHTPSGAFTPFLDSYGRVIFTRWDHLQRDQQADADFDQETYGTFNYADESAGAARLTDRTEVFPEPRAARTDLLMGTNLEGHSFNQFFPWEINEDGTAEETVNHVGRHEFQSYFNRTINNDPNVVEFISATTGRVNQNSVVNIFQVKESPTQAGRYFGIDAPEFSTHASGQVIAFDAMPSLPPDQIAITYYTHRDTASYTGGGTPPPTHSGHYRDILPLSDGTLVAAHTAETRADANTGTRQNPGTRYDFRLKLLTQPGQYWVAGAPLTSGISKSISYWDPDEMVSYNGQLWELQPVEVKSRVIPPPRSEAIPPPELLIFQQENVDPAVFKADLVNRNLALIVSRNVTTRDRLDKQQPFNLRITNTMTQTTGAGGTLYDISHMQMFQADQIRGIGGTVNPRPGRRVLGQVMHDPAVINPPNPTGPAGSVKLATDGSMASFVPARRALSWHLTSPTGTPVVRERYWLTFQPGEVRVCASCHGLSSKDQANQNAPQNPPEALRQILQHWKGLSGAVPPNVTNVQPSCASNVGGRSITLTGTGFVAGATVTLAGTPCNVTNLTATSITCTAGSRANGPAVTGNVVVTNPSMLSGMQIGTFTYGLRGDANNNGSLTAADTFYLNMAIFLGGSPVASVCQGDANSNNAVTGADAFFLNMYVFLGGAAPGP